MVACLLDVLEGGSKLSVRGDAAEASWRVMTPVLGPGAMAPFRSRSIRPVRAVRRRGSEESKDSAIKLPR